MLYDQVGWGKTYKDNVKELTNSSMVQVCRKAQDRREWRQLAMGATVDQSNDFPYNNNKSLQVS